MATRGNIDTLLLEVLDTRLEYQGGESCYEENECDFVAHDVKIYRLNQWWEKKNRGWQWQRGQG